MTRTPMALAESGVFTNLYSVLRRAHTAKLEVTLFGGHLAFCGGRQSQVGDETGSQSEQTRGLGSGDRRSDKSHLGGRRGADPPTI